MQLFPKIAREFMWLNINSGRAWASPEYKNNIWGAELKSEVVLTQNSTENRHFGGVLKITWWSNSQTTSSTGILQIGMDASIEKLCFESHNC